MSSTPASTLPEEKRQKILTEVAARYRLLCQQGLGAVARATAINRHVPKVLRGQNNGDRNRWWEWLDQAIKTPARTPPPAVKVHAAAATCQPDLPRYSSRPRPEKHYWWQDS